MTKLDWTKARPKRDSVSISDEPKGKLERRADRLLEPQVTPRFKQGRVPKRAREPKARAEREGNSEAYLAAIRRLPSCISGRSPCEAHHLLCAGGRGVGMKAPDKFAVPLTPDEHYKFHHIDKRASRTEFKWFTDRGVNPLDLTAALWSAFPDEEKMLSVLRAHLMCI